jgi:hypothetical protein
MTVSLIVDVNTRGIENLLAAAGERAPVAIARALNRAGAPARTAYLRQVRTILGLRNWRYGGKPVIDLLKGRTSARTANPGRLEYSLVGFGQGLPAKYYDPKEAPAGANINWLGKRQTIARSFYLGGRFPRRKTSALTPKGVMVRKGKGRWNLGGAKGPGVPEAMVTPGAQAIWLAQARARLPKEMAHQLYAILAGHARGSWRPQ